MFHAIKMGCLNKMNEANDESKKAKKIPLIMENVDLIDILNMFEDNIEWVDIPNSKLSIKDYNPDKYYKDFDYEVLEMILDAEEDDADFNYYDEVKKRASLMKFDTRQLKRATEYNKIDSLNGNKYKFSLIGRTIYRSGIPYLYMLG